MRASGWLRLARSFIVVLPLATAHSQGQSVAADAVAAAFARAWNTHDVEAFRQIYADDAEWITVAGLRHNGQAAIVAALEKEHVGWAAASTIRASTSRFAS
jgi:uncharacterized protein (TIGR02246 family)